VLISEPVLFYASNTILDYYRQILPKVPNFIMSLLRRKLVLWFLASEILRDYWLSGVSKCHSTEIHVDQIMTVLWTKLGLLMERTRPNMGYSRFGPCILRWGLVLDTLHFDDRQQNAHVVPSCVCRRLGCPSLVLNAMGSIFSGTVYPMGRQIRALSWNILVALAGSTGRDPRSGTRDNLATNPIPAACVCNSGIRTIDWLHLRDGGESDGAEQDRTRLCIPRRLQHGISLKDSRAVLWLLGRSG
jgi:hypothetical protein